MRRTDPLPRIFAARLLLGGALVVPSPWALPACNTATETSGGAACVYGEVVTCTLDGGVLGSQECLPDLSAYGPCRRSFGDGGAARDAGPRDAGSSGSPG
ncbi:MAG TPA: hypothetical protein VF395_20370 [Polyangiaceae bacterium]